MLLSFISDSTQWWQNMAIVVIFGLLIATFLTLVVVPVLYSILENMTRGLLLRFDEKRRTPGTDGGLVVPGRTWLSRKAS
jgi:predicted RND superfamily exporter protein